MKEALKAHVLASYVAVAVVEACGWYYTRGEAIGSTAGAILLLGLAPLSLPYLLLVMPLMALMVPPMWNIVVYGPERWFLGIIFVVGWGVYLTVLRLAHRRFLRTRRRRQRLVAGLCLDCGYDLRGNVSGTCPECGVGIELP